MSFDTYYPNHPWAEISTNQRTWYDPLLREVYYRSVVYSRFVTSQFALAGPNSPVTTSLRITSLIPPHGNSDPIGTRQLWMPSSYVDSFEREIVFKRYGGKMALHKYDDMITYWKKDGVGGLKRIVNNGLGTMMTEVMDRLAFNAFMDAPYRIHGGAATSFNDLAAGDTMSTDLLQDVRLGMAERGVPFTQMPRMDFTSAKPFCITSPGVIRDLLNEATNTHNSNAFIDVMKYADPSRIVRGEVGTYQGIRFIETPRATMWNAGAIVHQAAIKASVTAGDGALDGKVDNVRTTGQPSATKHITVDDVTGFAVNDLVTIHVDRTNANGVVDGVDFRDGKMTHRRIEAISGDGTGGTISFDYPIMEDFAVDLGGTVYGYVTKAQHVDSAVFIGGMDGVVMGVGEAPRIHMPRPVDDFDSMYRISWDGFFQYQLFNPEVFEVAFVRSSHRAKNRRSTSTIAVP